MIILGIDPGTAEMGWGVVEVGGAKGAGRKVKYVDHGMITTPSEEPLPKRLVTIKRGVEELVKEYKVSEIVIERVVFNVNKRSAISVAQAYGVILLLAGERNIPVYEYNALEAKFVVTGDGRADKKTVQQGIKKKLHLKKHPTPVHSADALAIALCHIEKGKGGK